MKGYEKYAKGHPKENFEKRESGCRSSNKLLVMRWKDKRDVYIFSTKHENAEMVEYTDKQKNQEHPGI